MSRIQLSRVCILCSDFATFAPRFGYGKVQEIALFWSRGIVIRKLLNTYCILKVFVVRTTPSPMSFEAEGRAHVRLNAGNRRCFQKVTKNSKCVGIESSGRHLEEDFL